MSTRAQAGSSSEGIDNFQLPKALVTRIAKSAMPHDAKLQKDTIDTLVNGATVFINYLAATAQDVASSRSRKTIAGPDILKALEIIEFGDLVPLLEGELESHRGVGKTDKGKGKPADVKGKGKEKEPLLGATDALKAQPKAFPAGEGHHEDQEPELAPAASENFEGRGEGGDDEDIGMAEGDPRDEEEDEEEEQDEEEEEADEDVEDEAGDEPEETVDMVAIKEPGLQRDQRGLGESGTTNGEE